MQPAIETGIPIPQRTRKVSKRAAYPFAQMRVGDSFAVPAKTDQQKDKVRNRLSGSAAYHKQGTSKQFTVRCLDSEVRCWRTK